MAEGMVESVRRVQELLSSVDPGENPKTVEFLDNARRRADVLSSIIESADLSLLPPSVPESVQSHVDSAIGQLEALGENADANQDYVDDAGIYLSDALHAAAPILVAAPLVAPEQQRESAAAFRRSVGQFLHSISEERDSASAALSAIKRTAEQISLAQESAASDAQAELERLKTEVASHEDRMGALASRLQADFLAAQESRQKVAHEAIARVEAAAEAQRAELEANATDALAALERHRDEAARLVNAVGQNAFAGGFGEYANGEQKAANFWRWITVASLVLIGAVGVWYLSSVGTAEFSLQAFWIRAVIILPPAFLAAYAARQSSRHRKNEVRARTVALELLALDPYLELLPDELRQPVKVKMADRFFGTSPNEPGDDTVGIAEAVEAVLRTRR